MEKNYYNEIKNKLIDNEVYKRVKDYSKNKNEISTYYEVGKLLIDAQGGEERAKYGDGLIKEYSNKLTKEVDRKYGYRNLYNMRKFYITFKNNQILHTSCAILTWSHIREMLIFNDINEINYYINVTESYTLSVRQ